MKVIEYDSAIKSISVRIIPNVEIRSKYELENHAKFLFRGANIFEYEPRAHGWWIFNGGAHPNKSWYICSLCGDSIFHEQNYCPNCGAKMDLRGQAYTED